MSENRKKAPPDDLGNLRGRILAIRTTAYQIASVDAKGGADFERSFARRLAESEPILKGLRRRLAALAKGSPSGSQEAREAMDFLDSLKSL